MKKLTEREDQIMQIVWKLKTVFIRDIIAEMTDDPKPHYNTVATLVKILVTKNFLKSEKIGNTHQYSPTIAFEEYRDGEVKEMKKKYFGNSFQKMLSHFAKKEEFTDEEIKEMIKIIKSKKQ